MAESRTRDERRDLDKKTKHQNSRIALQRVWVQSRFIDLTNAFKSYAKSLDWKR